MYIYICIYQYVSYNSDIVSNVHAHLSLYLRYCRPCCEHHEAKVASPSQEAEGEGDAVDRRHLGLVFGEHGNILRCSIFFQKETQHFNKMMN